MDLHAGYAEVQDVALAGLTAEQEQRHLLAYAPLVKRIARQLGSQAAGSMDRDDFEQIGLMGLLEALRRYGEPDAQFGGFAALRIRGAILDELRRQDWRPRAVRQESHRVRDGVRDLRRRLGRDPSEAEIRTGLGLSAEAYQDHLMAENAETIASFDELVNDLVSVPSQGGSPEDILTTRRSIEQGLRALDEREQRVIQLYYEHDLSYKEIAAVLGLTDARVCQLNKGALKKMKALLEQT